LTFSNYWNPHILGELNSLYTKVAKFKDELVWRKYHHEENYLWLLKELC